MGLVEHFERSREIKVLTDESDGKSCKVARWLTFPPYPVTYKLELGGFSPGCEGTVLQRQIKSRLL